MGKRKIDLILRFCLWLYNQISRYLFCSHFLRMALVMKQNEAFDEIMISIFSRATQMFGSGNGSNLFQQFRFLPRRVLLKPMRISV